MFRLQKDNNLANFQLFRNDSQPTDPTAGSVAIF
jgi:hypothetical protein